MSPFACAVIISQLYTSVVTFYFLVFLENLYRVQQKERRQKASETLPELGQAMRRLVNKAYPKAPAKVREMLSTKHAV
jgi:hypothetical protein